MLDIGIKLVDKTGNGCDIDELVDVINIALEKYDYRVKQWGDWEGFRKSCVKEEKHVNSLLLR